VVDHFTFYSPNENFVKFRGILFKSAMYQDLSHTTSITVLNFYKYSAQQFIIIAKPIHTQWENSPKKKTV